MDNPRQPPEADGLPAPGPGNGPDAETPPDFYPLRLIHQPSGRPLELIRPIVLVGRHTEADVRLPLPDVSRRHCRFTFSEGRWQVHDLNSLNGVYVNHQAVQRADLQQGDLVRIGGFVFTVDLTHRESSGGAEATEEMVRSIFDALPPPAPPPRRRAS
jgi:pSer/pThr/pTyr-binding forkhead associated (FHA) protein